MTIDMVMRRRAGLALAIAGLASAAVLGSCRSNEKVEQVCPRVAVLTDAGTLTEFASPAGRDILDIDFQGDIADIVASCEYSDDKKNRQLAMQVSPVFSVTRGAANTDRTARFTYFVSVVRGEQILTKQEFETSTEFAGNRTRVVFQDSDPVTIDIPLPHRAAEYEYQVLLGFQLTPEQLEYNKKWRSVGR